jgi:hypothetical protein
MRNIYGHEAYKAVFNDTASRVRASMFKRARRMCLGGIVAEGGHVNTCQGADSSMPFGRLPGDPGSGRLTVFLSVSCHAHDTDAGDLALRIEAEEKAGRIAARKVKLYQVECLLSDRTG